jgi:hypothetical protein
MLRRIDPPDCGCTDCLTGESKPVTSATNEELLLMARNEIINATERTIEAEIVFTFDVGDDKRIVRIKADAGAAAGGLVVPL